MINEALKLLSAAEDLLVLAIGVVAQQDFAVFGASVVLVDAFAWGVVFVGHGSRELWPGAGGENSLPYHITTCGNHPEIPDGSARHSIEGDYALSKTATLACSSAIIACCS